MNEKKVCDVISGCPQCHEKGKTVLLEFECGGCPECGWKPGSSAPLRQQGVEAA